MGLLFSGLLLVDSNRHIGRALRGRTSRDFQYNDFGEITRIVDENGASTVVAYVSPAKF